MGRPRREIYSGQTYEICIRTRKGLPFVCTKYMKLLIEGIMARVQRDSKVTVCHYLWMANHLHVIVVSKDKLALTQFYGEIQKQLTDAIKRLLGLTHLNLWKKNATESHPLRVEPNAWMKTFAITSVEGIEECNTSIRTYHLGLEKEAREKRKKKKQKPMGKHRLVTPGLDLSYDSKKVLKRIFVYSLDSDLRVTYLVRMYQKLGRTRRWGLCVRSLRYRSLSVQSYKRP